MYLPFGGGGGGEMMVACLLNIGCWLNKVDHLNILGKNKSTTCFLLYLQHPYTFGNRCYKIIMSTHRLHVNQKSDDDNVSWGV